VTNSSGIEKRGRGMRRISGNNEKWREL